MCHCAYQSFNDTNASSVLQEIKRKVKVIQATTMRFEGSAASPMKLRLERLCKIMNGLENSVHCSLHLRGKYLLHSPKAELVMIQLPARTLYSR